MDLVPYATAVKWGSIKPPEQLLLLKATSDALGLLLRDSGIRLLVLNGRSVIKNFEVMANITLVERHMEDSWALPRGNGSHIPGFSYTQEKSTRGRSSSAYTDTRARLQSQSAKQFRRYQRSCLEYCKLAWSRGRQQGRMKPGDRPEADRIAAALGQYERRSISHSPGSRPATLRAVLIEQIIHSQRRNEYIQRLRFVDLAESGADPQSQGFDPLKAAIVQQRRANFDEACWMVFLYVHFGKHLRAQWRYAREVYGKLDQGGSWGWQEITSDVNGFRKWLADNQPTLLRRDEARGFGNHRKYESLDGWSRNGTGEVVATYVDWVTSEGGHARLFESAIANGSPEASFDGLYRSMDRVQRFGRTARFDYLSLICET